MYLKKIAATGVCAMLIGTPDCLSSLVGSQYSTLAASAKRSFSRPYGRPD